MVKTQDLFGDGGLLKRVLKAGAESHRVPRLGARVKIRYVGSLAACGTRFDSGLAEFHTGEAQVIAAWDKGVSTMSKGEVADFVCRADYAFGESGKPPQVAPDTAVKYEIELLSYQEPARELWEMSPADKLEEALRLKAAGAEAFKASEWAAALSKYREAASLLDGFAAPELLFSERTMTEQQAHTTLVACWLNEAMCDLKLDDAHAAEAACGRVLALEPENVKALFRRGTALTNLSQFGAARRDLKEANRLDPSSKEIRAMWETCKQREASSKQQGDAIFGKMTAKAVYREVVGVEQRRPSTLPRVWFDVSVGGERAGRIVFELFSDRVPKTCENFRCLCTGERGVSAASGRPLHYKGCGFHRTLTMTEKQAEVLYENSDGSGRRFETNNALCIVGGDITNGDGTGGESIYGAPFADESFDIQHTEPGLLSMAGCPPDPRPGGGGGSGGSVTRDNNTSQFFITTKNTTQALGGARITHFDYRHVVFGKVVKGMEIVHRIQKLPRDGRTQRPLEAVVIEDCGEETQEPGGAGAG